MDVPLCEKMADPGWELDKGCYGCEVMGEEVLACVSKLSRECELQTVVNFTCSMEVREYFYCAQAEMTR